MNDHANEIERLRIDTLRDYQVLDTPPEAPFDRITQLAMKVLKAPIAQISFVDAHRQWFKSIEGLDIRETPRNESFCTHTIKADEPLIVPDALADPRFCQLPRVVGAPYVRSYIGASLCAANGQRIGALSVLDTKVRHPSAEEIGLVQNLARIVMDQLELRQAATTDHLTGALSRGAFIKAAARDVARARRLGSAQGCMLLDLDHFKSVNDKYGHAAGDQALQQVVAVMSDGLRGSDYIGRLGGEEFAVMLPGAGSTEALDIGERVRHTVMRAGLAMPDGYVRLTVSVGVATLSRTDDGISDLLRRADDALYAAKIGGRNRLVCGDTRPLTAA